MYLTKQPLKNCLQCLLQHTIYQYALFEFAIAMTMSKPIHKYLSTESHSTEVSFPLDEDATAV